MSELEKAIVLIKARTPKGYPWELDDLVDIDPRRPADVDHAIVLVLNAVADGDLIPAWEGEE